MKKGLSTEFNIRQDMTSEDYEIFYYHDSNLKRVNVHKHNHYEFYFLLEGNLDYEVDGNMYPLTAGDFLLIPPSILHRPCFYHNETPYRRVVLWISSTFFDMLCRHSNEFSYGYMYVEDKKHYHYSPGFIISQEIQGRLIELIEETNSNHSFHNLHCYLKVASFIADINRIIYDLTLTQNTTNETPLYILLCDYINLHLTENLSLDVLAQEFYVSKYHIAHMFKENMGLGVQQYISKRRLHMIKNNIPSGIPLTQLALDYGFSEYTTFFRAFKKEYGLSPLEYRKQATNMEDYISL